MAQQSARQRRTTGRVMHEFKHGELKRSPGGKGGKVKNPKQAIAIALKEAGASKYESKSDNKRNERKTERKEAKGRTAQQEREGKAKVGASGRRESTRALGGRNARQTTAKRPGRRSNGPTRQELYARAQRRHIAGRSRMNKQELREALGLG
jgi:hypothetical protein